MRHDFRNDEGRVYYTIEYLPEKKMLYSAWYGSYPTLEQVIQGASYSLEKVREYKVTRVMNDNRKLEGNWDEANQWVVDVWIPEAIASGLRKFAHILSADIFAMLSAEFMEQNSKKVVSPDVLQMRNFESPIEAEKWLLAD